MTGSAKACLAWMLGCSALVLHSDVRPWQNSSGLSWTHTHAYIACLLNGKTYRRVRCVDAYRLDSASSCMHAQRKGKDMLAAGECIDAVSGELTFFTLPNCFELFGFDLMVDDCWQVWLLEVCPLAALLCPALLCPALFCPGLPCPRLDQPCVHCPAPALPCPAPSRSILTGPDCTALPCPCTALPP